MGSYADSLLTQGEQVIRRERQHWLALFLESRLSVILWGIGLLLLLVVLWRGRNDEISGALSIGATGIILIGLAFFAYRWWNWKTDEYVITTRRLLKVEGIFNKRSGDSNLEKINDAILEQNLVARILDYGDLKILTAAEVSVDHYRMLNHAKSFKKQMMTAKHALEDGRPYGDVPTAPVRASAPIPPAGPAEPTQAQRAETPDEVAQSLTRLAALRDSGAITAEEYDAKKQEMLGRL